MLLRNGIDMKINIQEFIKTGATVINLIDVPIPLKRIIGRWAVNTTTICRGEEIVLNPSKRYYYDVVPCSCHSDRWEESVIVEFIETEIDNPAYDREMEVYEEYLSNKKVCDELYNMGFTINLIRNEIGKLK